MGFPRTAALYMRMSTEKQDYSISHQRYALEIYAAANEITVVREYCDEGKSGLALKGRDGLRQLLDDVISARASFNTVMVYDVSRWGRFQDVDEAAHYEFLCRSAGIAVVYCAEQFQNDGTALSSMVKTIKRAMAAEYSRELSEKVFQAQCRFARLGFKQGGSAGYGLRRISVTIDGEARCILAAGERKRSVTDRVMYAPGPAQEVAIVQQIYRWFVREKYTYERIAKTLNARGTLCEFGRRWTSAKVKSVLSNEKYLGHLVFNKWSGKLGIQRAKNTPELRIRYENAFAGVVSVKLFRAAQRESDERTRVWTDEEMLAGLRAIYEKHGKLTSDLVNLQEGNPSDNCYREHFGTLANAFALSGAGARPGWNRYEMMSQTKVAMGELLKDVIDRASVLAQLAGATVTRTSGMASLTVNEALRVRVVICRRRYPNEKISRWRFRLRYKPTPDFVLAAQLDETNSFIRSYFLLPVAECQATYIWLREEPNSRYFRYRHASLEDIFGVCAVRMRSREVE